MGPNSLDVLELLRSSEFVGRPYRFTHLHAFESPFSVPDMKDVFGAQSLLAEFRAFGPTSGWVDSITLPTDTTSEWFRLQSQARVQALTSVLDDVNLQPLFVRGSFHNWAEVLALVRNQNPNVYDNLIYNRIR